MSILFLDCEVYRNYTLICLKDIVSNKTLSLEAKNGSSFTNKQKRSLSQMLKSHRSVGFNSLNYDLPIISAIVSGKTTYEIYYISKDIIELNLPHWSTYNNFNIMPLDIPHIDIMEVAQGVGVGLKLYGARLHTKTLQDLPYNPDWELDEEQMKHVKDYCINDLNVTIELYNHIKSRLDVREEMIKHYGFAVMSKSDAQIAELIIKKDLGLTGKIKTSYPNKLKYSAPDFIKFETPKLRELLKLVENCEFNLKGGKVSIPAQISKFNLKIGGTAYKIGIGGLHSMEKSQAIFSDDSHFLIDKDVASYYPQIILNLELYPKQLGYEFLTLFKSKVKERLTAKRNKDKVKNETLKILINAPFGKLGSPYSALYAPDIMLNVTLTGQLSLLMIIEKLEINGISVVSANTDGFVSLIPKHKYDLYEDLCQDWELDTGFTLEDNHYKALYSRDVNNYLAITETGYKGKGIFTMNQISKSPQGDIIYIAVIEYFKNKTPIEETIKNCKEICKFLFVRSVAGGGVFNDKYLGKVVRWVYSKNGGIICYKKNNNRVPKASGCTPVMDLSQSDYEIDYDRYINDAYDLLISISGKGTLI